jgi:hypothetical protein
MMICISATTIMGMLLSHISSNFAGEWVGNFAGEWVGNFAGEWVGNFAGEWVGTATNKESYIFELCCRDCATCSEKESASNLLVFLDRLMMVQFEQHHSVDCESNKSNDSAAGRNGSLASTSDLSKTGY